jgi:hypothetical protein
LFSHYWEWVVRSGVESHGKGYPPTRDEAIGQFKAVWEYVNQAARDNSAGGAATEAG